MSHRRRLDRLEEQFGPGAWRCDVCHTWPDYRMEHGPDYRGLNGPPPAYPPAECPNCSYRPQIIAIEYADDWRAL